MKEDTIDEMLKEFRENNEQNKYVKNQKGLRKPFNKQNSDEFTEMLFKEDKKKNLLKNFQTQEFEILDQKKEIEKQTKYEKKGTFNNFFNKKKTILEDEKQLFYKFTFVFVPDKYELTEARMQVLKNQIIKKGGNVYECFSEIINLVNFYHKFPDKQHLIIVSKSLFYEDCCKFLDKFSFDLRNFDMSIIDFEWIIECLKVDDYINPENYRRFKQFSNKNNIELNNQYECPSLLINEQLNKNMIVSNIINRNELLLNQNPEGNCLNVLNTEEIEKISEEICNDSEYHNYHNDNIQNSQKNNNYKDFRYLFDYLYDSDDDVFKDIKREKIESPLNINNEILYEDSDEIQIIGHNKKIKLEDSCNIRDGTIFEGIDCDVILPNLKEFKYDNPGQKKREKFWDSRKDNFFCSSAIPKTNLNSFITDELDKLLKIYSNEKDKGRMHAYRKAISTIKSQTKQIETVHDVEDLPNIGQKIKAKIKEILETGKLRKAECLQETDYNKAIETLSGVWGIGPTTASKFYYKNNIKNIEDLRKNQHLLNSNQKIGLKYYEELKERIPRSEIDKVCSIVHDKIEELSDIKNSFEMIPCGSYRRGKETCGDIDLLITRKDGANIRGFLMKLISSLEGILLTDHLALPKSGSHDSETYMGVYQLNKEGVHRRIDMKIYPREHFGYAVLYFTGSDYFNRSMRLFARKKGYTLSDHGLHPAFRFKNHKVWEGENVPCYREEDVFKILGLDYRKPEERNA